MVCGLGSNTQTSPRLCVEVREDVTALAEVWQLRSAQFRDGRGPDRDDWDTRCRHVLIRDRVTGALAGCFRMMVIDGPEAVTTSYTGERYDLRELAVRRDPMVEVGRFCIAKDHAADPDILRLAWTEVTRQVDAHGAGFLFGCASFPGTDPARHAAAFAQLRARVAHRRWQVGRQSRATISLVEAAGDASPSPVAIPPLLRSYLAMGGLVSDHLVVDHDLGTLHVFAGLEVRAVPAARARSLRRLAG
ncbi:MAG: GNAT family N-acetyltransferase [Rhodobacteraceae bacterium]|nr:GNAT family N-acetyltransferase [Paracoccaceae bacterium]